MKALITKSTGSWYQALTEDQSLIEVRLRGKFKLIDKKITNPITVGDVVMLEQIDEDYMIKEISPRRNYVIRTSPRKKGYAHLIAANIDQAMIVASLRQPRTSLGFIDRFLITLETFRIPGVIIFNKADVYIQEELDWLEELKELYQSLGYQTIITSFQQEGDTQVRPYLTDNTTLLCGHSGTGKSTLINLLFPEGKQAVREVSEFADKGVHTTTFGEMFIKTDAFKVIDTPGIKELGLAEVTTEELSHYFPEMRSLIGQCKFNNCQHINEPGCAVKAAVEEGLIADTRFDSYLSMMLGDDNRR